MALRQHPMNANGSDPLETWESGRYLLGGRGAVSSGHLPGLQYCMPRLLGGRLRLSSVARSYAETHSAASSSPSRYFSGTESIPELWANPKG